MSAALTELCAAHGIEPHYVGMDGRRHAVAQSALAALAAALRLEDRARATPATIAQAHAETDPPTCHVPVSLATQRVWGLTCQLASLATRRNMGMGDFADLSTLCRLAAAEGADFVGVNPLHALFWSAPAHASPFSPSNRQFLNPLYLAVDRIDGYAGLAPEEAEEAARLRSAPLVDFPAVAALKDRVLRRLFAYYPWDGDTRTAFRAFCAAGGEALAAHALFEAISEVMKADGLGAGWSTWPEPFRSRHTAEVDAFAAANSSRVDYHLWLQWLADRQLAQVRRDAQEAGLRVGLYLDFAVGTAPDGSATWTDPDLTVPGLSIGAPPDAFSAAGQDWGLAPLSPLRLAAMDCRPFAEAIAAALRHAGAVRLDHAMGLARLWLIPRGESSSAGAYVRYPLTGLLARTAEESQRARAIVVGEDLGTVPEGFRALLAARRIHSYKVLFFEQGPAGFHDPAGWPVDALACLATHDLPTFAGWWAGAEIALGRSLGRLAADDLAAALKTRAAERRALARLVGRRGEPADLSPLVHARIATSPCRLVALQIEDALGLADQVNVPGTTDQHPNWRRRLPVDLDRIADHPGFQAHAAALRTVRPR